MDKHNLYCNECGDTGWIVAFRKSNMAQYGFRCGKCKKASFQRLSEIIPYWVPTLMADFTTVFTQIERKDDKTHEDSI